MKQNIETKEPQVKTCGFSILSEYFRFFTRTHYSAKIDKTIF